MARASTRSRRAEPPPAGFTLRFKGAPFVRQWMRRVHDREGERIEFYWETDWRAVGGVEQVPAGAVLFIDRGGRPLRYELHSDRSPLRRAVFSDDAVEVTLTDGSSFLLPSRGRPDLVFQHNVVLQLAAFLARRRTTRTRATFFSPEAMRCITVQIARSRGPRGATRFKTSLGFELVVDAHGRLVSMAASQGTDKAGSASLVDGAAMTDPLPAVRLESIGAAPRLRYQPPAGARFLAEDAAIDGEVVLGGCYTRPPGDGPFPALVFLQGSGRHDRHGMTPGLDLGTHRIADHLSAEGFACLRFDGRGTGTTPFGPPERNPWEARLLDARAALAWIASRPEVDREAVFLIGHSLGALCALRIEVQQPPVAPRGLVLMAPAGRTLDRILLEQVRRESRRLALPPDAARLRRQRLAAQLRALRSPRRKAEPAPAAAALAGLSAEGLSLLLGEDPLAAVRAGRAPLLICQGGKDIQVSLIRDAVPLAEAAAASGRPAELRVFPLLDHLFKVEPGTSEPAHYFADRPTGPDFLESLRDWLRARCAAR